MNMFENGAGTIGNNHKPFSDRGIKIHCAAGDHETNQLHRQSRSMMSHIIFASFSCICFVSCHIFDEMNEDRP